MRIDSSTLETIIKIKQTLGLSESKQADRKTNLNADSIQTGSTKALEKGSNTSIDKTYLGIMSTKEDILEAAKNQDAKLMKDQMALLSNTMTAEDYRKFTEEGFDFNNAEIDTIVTVVDKIKIALAAGGKVDSFSMNDVSLEQIKKVSGNSQLAFSIAKKMKEHNLPLTEENLGEAINAVSLAGSFFSLSEGAISYLSGNQKEPTIENVYKAQHSGATGTNNQTPPELDVLESQIQKVIQDSGLEVTEETMSDAKWLLVNQNELTKETLNDLRKLREISFPIEEEQIIDAVVQSVEEGKRPYQALLVAAEDFLERGSKALQVIEQATDEDLKTLIYENKEINIAGLDLLQKNSKISRIQEDGSNTEARFLTAKRKLEEIRLEMTLEANIKLLRKGIHIETESLENLVEELKEAENSYYRELLNSTGISPEAENIDILKETGIKIEAIKLFPVRLLGNVAAFRTETTVSSIYEEGTLLKKELEKANQTYETLMTKPRSDMGDSIRKAFRNVDSILETMNLETTLINQRAVRILGYNQMEITPESIARIKDADVTVTSLVKNLTPGVTLELIRKNKNPLHMQIDELNQEIAEIKSQQSHEKEKYSEFLWRLEQSQEITDREKEAFIGIHRLLNQVEKTDGSVIGSLLLQGSNITLKNLLTGVRTQKGRGIDVKIDKEFGALEELVYRGSSISEQISSGFQEQQDAYREDSSLLQEKSYYSRTVNELLKTMTPSLLSRVTEESDIGTIPLGDLAWEINSGSISSAEDQAYEESQLSQLASMKDVESNVIRQLTDMNQPVTLQNLVFAANMTTRRGSVFQGLVREAEKSGKEEKGSILSLMKESQEAVTDTESMDSYYKELEEVSGQLLEKAMENEKPLSLDLKVIQSLHKEIGFYRELAKKEQYQFPVTIAGEVTSIRLSFVSDSKEKGKVKITMEHQDLGKIAAEFRLNDGKIEGYIMADTEAGIHGLKASYEALKTEIETEERKIGPIQYITGKGLDLSHFELLKGKETAGVLPSSKELYETAKAFITTIKNIHKEV